VRPISMKRKFKLLYELFDKIAHEKDVRIEMVIKRAIASYAKMLRDDEE
jgi:hypothetical protein